MKNSSNNDGCWVPIIFFGGLLLFMVIQSRKSDSESVKYTYTDSLEYMSQSPISTPSFSASGLARVYDENTNKKIGNQYIKMDLANSEAIIGNRKFKVSINRTYRDNSISVSVYDCWLNSLDNLGVWACINKYDDGHYTIVVDYSDGKLLYEL